MNHDFLHTFLFQDKIEFRFKYGGRAGYILLQIFSHDNINYFLIKIISILSSFSGSIFYEVYTYPILRGKWIIFRDTYQANIKLIKNMPFEICHECEVCDIALKILMLSSLLKMRLKMSPALTVHSTHSSMKCQVPLYFFSAYSQSAPLSPTRYPRNDCMHF